MSTLRGKNHMSIFTCADEPLLPIGWLYYCINQHYKRWPYGVVVVALGRGRCRLREREFYIQTEIKTLIQIFVYNPEEMGMIFKGTDGYNSGANIVSVTLQSVGYLYRE